jgi:beta-lactamase class A
MKKRLIRSQLVSVRSTRVSPHRARRAWRWGALAIVAMSAVGVAATFEPAPPEIAETILSGGVRQAQAAPPPFLADCSASPAVLQQDLDSIARGFDGEVGIAVTKAGCDWTAGMRQRELFPQQSVSKLWVAMAVLDAADREQLRLDQNVSIGPADLTLFNQPLRGAVLEQGMVWRPVVSLMSDALAMSDNTANDRLLWTVGGPDVVRAMLRDKAIQGVRFGPGERLLQSQIAGVTWRQDLSLGRNFEQERAKLPGGLRQDLLENYLADPIDGATPEGIAKALGRLATGQLLSEGSTAVMMDILSRTRSGPRRLKAGVPQGWKVYHKTGTGQELGRVATGYNDVAVIETPDGAFFGVAVMIRKTTVPMSVRMEMMQEVSRAVGRFHQAASTS